VLQQSSLLVESLLPLKGLLRKQRLLLLPPMGLLEAGCTARCWGSTRQAAPSSSSGGIKR
jgi:hypothetical protein